MPPIDEAFNYLLGLFFDSGQCLATGQGLVPLTWQEIDAWIRVNRLELTLWEIETISKMSSAYCSEYSKSTDPQRPAPYSIVKEEDEIDEEAEMRKALSWRSMIRAQSKK